MSQLDSLLPVLAMALAGIIALALAFLGWRKRTVPGGNYFVLFMLFAASYAIGNAGELAAVSIPGKLHWTKLIFSSAACIAPFWVLFAVGYSRRDHWLTRYRVILLWLVPVVAILLALTNEWHSLIWIDATPVSSDFGSGIIYTHGIGFWVLVAYDYACLLVANILLAHTAWRLPRLFRRQVAGLIIAAIVPGALNVIYLFANPWPGIDLTPISFTVTGLILVWNFSRIRMFELTPVAYDVLFNSIGDGVIVLDEHDQILDLNPIARRYANIDHEVIGRQLSNVLPLEKYFDAQKVIPEGKILLHMGEGETRRVYDLTITSLYDRHGHLHGRAALLHDLSREQSLLDRLTALQSISRVVASSLELDKIFETIVKLLYDTFGYGLVSIYQLDGERLKLRSQVGYPIETVYWEVPITQGILGRTVRTRRPQFLTNVDSDPDFLRAAPDVDHEICVPLIKDDRVLGLLNVESPAPPGLSQGDLDLLIAFANQAAVAIENARLYAEIQRLAVIDDLTGLYNRRGLFERGRLEFERVVRMNRPLSVMFVDIDHFKQFNDKYSYSVGDHVLRRLADCLRSNIRVIDLAGRYGGEEFVVIFPGIEQAAAVDMADLLRSTIKAMYVETGQGSVSITVSIGVYQKSEVDCNLEMLIERAGQALHLAKSEGRDRVAVYNYLFTPQSRPQ